MNDFISPREAAKQLHISLNATYAAVWAGRLRAEKRDGKWLISVEAVEEHLQRRRSRDKAKNAPSESRDFIGSEPAQNNRRIRRGKNAGAQPRMRNTLNRTQT